MSNYPTSHNIEPKEPSFSISKLFWFLLKLLSWTSVGSLFAAIFLIFKAPEYVQELPLNPKQGYAYITREEKVSIEWAEKRKLLFTQEGIRVELSPSDLNAWAKAFLKYEPIHTKPLNYSWKTIHNLKNSFTVCPEEPPFFDIDKAGIHSTQKVIFRIGTTIQLPIFIQCTFYPQNSSGILSWEIKDCRVGWLQLKALGVPEGFIQKVGYNYLAKKHPEIKRIVALEKAIETITLEQNLLIIQKK